MLKTEGDGSFSIIVTAGNDYRNLRKEDGSFV